MSKAATAQREMLALQDCILNLLGERRHCLESVADIIAAIPPEFHEFAISDCAAMLQVLVAQRRTRQ